MPIGWSNESLARLESAMNAYASLERFSLAEHGDPREQAWAPVVAKHFPAYEQFWRNYVVPITYRIDPQVAVSATEWKNTRANVSEVLEQIEMHHYSVLYYFVRATEEIERGNIVFPEDVFSLLDSCGDNISHFFNKIQKIAKDFGTPINLPTQKKQMGVFDEIGKYRNAFLHNAVLARSVAGNRTFLPKADMLKEVESSWRKAARLPPEQWTECNELYERVHRGVKQFLEQQWSSIMQGLNTARQKNPSDFNKQWAIQEFMPCLIGPPTPSMAQSTSLSGTCLPFALGTASNAEIK
jgi:hypothetical protein